jgi:signal transduction histidine kinase
MPPRPAVAASASWSALLGVVVAVVLAGTAIGIDIAIARSGMTAPVAPGWVGGIQGVALAATGGLLLWRMSWQPLAAVLFAAGIFFALFGLASAWVNAAVTIWPEAPLTYAALLLNQRFSALALAAIPLVLVLFPDGRLPRRASLRALAIASIVCGGIAVALTLLMPWHVLALTSGLPDTSIVHFYREPWGVALTPAAWEVLGVVEVVTFVAAPILAIAVLIGRRFGAGPELQRQLRWIAWAGSLFVVVFVTAPLFLPWLLAQIILQGAIVLVCVAIAVAVLRHRLHDIDRVLGWTALYGLLVVAVVVVDLVLLTLVGGLLGESSVALVAALLVLVAFAPLREPLLAWINRLIYGRRGDPYGVVSGLADSLEHADDPDDQLIHIARTIARAFASPYVAVRVDEPDGRRLSATHGSTDGPTVVLPLSYRGETIGELEMAPARRTTLSRRDERLLADVVRQAAAAVRATVLNEELQRIREELVVAREEERMRFRRDVHDGLGPALAAVKVRIDAARNVAGRDPAAADRILETASAGVTDAVRDIRRIVLDLRPPTIDDLGLERAIERICDQLGAGSLSVSLDYRVPVALPPAFEVAVYRIVSEALTNISKHAGAKAARVRIEARAEAVIVEVVDDGSGIAPEAPGGVGLRSMRERTAELGGALSVTSPAGHGTVVTATLPLRRTRAKETVDA